MKIVGNVLAALVVAMAAAGPVSAHHSFAAQYDANSPVTLKGVVTKVEWMNPHAILDGIRRQLAHGRFQSDALYGDGAAGPRIADVLARAPLSVQKRLMFTAPV